MNRDYYYLKEIFLGLREEYLQNELLLTKLKEYIILKDKRINDFYFYLYQNQNLNTTQLWLSLEEKKKSLLTIICEYLRLSTRNSTECLVTKTNPKNYNLKDNKFNIEFNKEKYRELNEDLEIILNSDFVKNMLLDYQDKKNNTKINLTLSKIIFATEEYWFDYFSYNKEYFSIVNTINSKAISSNNILNLLETKVPKEYFSNYHKQIIEKNKDLKEIKIEEDIFKGGYADLEIEEKNGIVLCKKKVK